MVKQLFKTSIILLLIIMSACKEEETHEATKPDYSSLFNYNVSLWCNNMTDEDITLQLVYFGYKKVTVKAKDSYFATRVNALDLLYYFNVDLSDPYLNEGQIRYFISCKNEILKYGWLNRTDNLADMIITKNKKGELEVSGTDQKHLD